MEIHNDIFVELIKLKDFIRREQVEKPSWSNKLLIRKIEELATQGYNVNTLQATYVWALRGYFEFYKTQPEYYFVTNNSYETIEKKSSMLEYYSFLRELSRKKRAFRHLGNDFFSKELANIENRWLFYK